MLPEGRRIALEAVQLDDGEPLQRWLRVRLKKGDAQEIGTGDTVRVRALVRPPMPPAYPGAWDLQRDAWYSGQAGSGYALGPVERIAETPPSGPLRLVQRLREVIARRISAVVPGAAGAVSVTLLTGVTTGIPPADHDAFRASGPRASAGRRGAAYRHRHGLDAGIRPPRRSRRPSMPACTGRPRSSRRWRRWRPAAATWC